MSRFAFNLDSLSRKQRITTGRSDSWIHSKIVLYLVLAASLFQLFILASSENYRGALSFVLIASVMFYFSKNMVVILTSALAVSALIGIIPGYSLPKEGMEDASEEEEDASEAPAPKKGAKASSSKEAKEDSKVISDLKKDGENLIKTQEIIMNNFKKISPELDKVESLVASMNETAATLSNPTIKEKLAASMMKP